MLIWVFLVGELDARTESETQPALTHATDKSVRVEIGLARSALPPSLHPPHSSVVLHVDRRGVVYVFMGPACRQDPGAWLVRGVQLFVGRGAGMVGPGARPHRPDPSGGRYPVSNY